MSWSYSRALVVEYLDQCCLDTELSAQLNTTPMPDQFYWPDKTTEHSRLSRFGMMSVPLMESLGEGLLIVFQEASRARTLALQEKGLDWTAKAQGYGEKWRGLLGRFDPVTCSLKTAQLSLVEGLTESCLTLPRWGLMLNGELYQQPIPALCISEKGFGYWPTPDASSGKRGFSKTIAEKVARGDKTRKSGAKIGTSLAWEPRLLADYQPGRRINPEFEEWLMGWPIAHTDLSPLETDRFQEFEQQHGGF